MFSTGDKVSSDRTEVTDSCKITSVTAKGSVHSMNTAKPSEFSPSALRPNSRAASKTAIIKEARTTEAENPATPSYTKSTAPVKTVVNQVGNRSLRSSQ